MTSRSITAAALVVGALLVVFARRTKPDGEGATESVTGRLATQRAEQAWMSVEGVYEGIYSAGYVRYTASQLASMMISSGNAAQAAGPQDQPPSGGRPAAPKPVPYVLGRPTGPWQIVVVPNDDRNVVRVELYGNDLNTPMKTAEFSAR